jgi:hypothetical protein
VSVSDSDDKSEQLDVAEEIKRILSYGAKTPTKLRDAVIAATGVSRRVYYRHLKKLCDSNIVEEKGGMSTKHGFVRFYALNKSPGGIFVMKQGRFGGQHLNTFPKSFWELYAWIWSSPGDWPVDDDHITLIYDFLPSLSFVDVVFPPKVKRYCLDPDRYIYSWPITFKKELEISNSLPRFFNLKKIYQAKLYGVINKFELKGAPSYLGVKEFVDDEGVNRQVAVVVRRRSDGKLQVFRVEFNPRFSEKWVEELCREHDVEGCQIIGSKDRVFARRTVFHLDKVLHDGRLLIPSKYSLLLRDLGLFNFNYTPPPKPSNRAEELMLREYRETAGNFVHALAGSVSCADGLGNNRGILMMLKKRLKFW